MSCGVALPITRRCKRRTELQGIETLDQFILLHKEIVVGDGAIRLQGQGAETALRLYRDNYRPSARHPEPNAALCVWAMVLVRRSSRSTRRSLCCS